MLRLHKNNTGSSLIEVLVAVLVVGLVVTGVMMSITYSVKNSAEAQYRETASQLAQDGMELVKLRRDVQQWFDFVGVADGNYCLGDPSGFNSVTVPLIFSAANKEVNPSDDCTAFTVQNVTYQRYVEIVVAADDSNVKATVVVEWDSGSNDSRDVRITQTFRERAI